ncbi:MAG TPA: type II secretion system protein [Candidatus Saccharimonadales bacterium]|nr:type II secretion system protein [Candidatus Saccharimonadales bacterium]
MISLKRKESGFTLVELLIVIVVIGILAAIVITTFTGVQKKGRDAERKSDVKSIASHMEIYFSENSRYPTLTDLNTATWRTANAQGLNDDLLEDPSNTGTTTIAATAPGGTSSTYQYSYVPSPAGCDNTATNGDCTDFTLEANLENEDANFVIEGSNTP